MLHAWSRRTFGLVFALVAIAIAPRLIHAQTGKVTGVVTDASTGQPLEGVQVFLQGTGYGHVTNSSGRYFIISVPPGTYTVVTRRIGYQTAQFTNTQVVIDVTREVNVALNVSSQTLAAVRVEAQQAPLVEPGQTASQIPITAEQIQALPVTSIEGALALQQGFIQAPSSTDLISYNESRRNSQNPIHIRGGRGGETLMLIDGIPVNNFIFGGPAISLSPEAVQQIDFLKGGMGAEYGNALSGVINITTKEGGGELAGALKYQTSKLGGEFGLEQDELKDYNLVEGFLSGPVPGTGDKMGFVFSGRQERQADEVFEFDQNFFLPSQMPGTEALPPGGPNFRDVFPGWRAFGFNNTRQVFGKLSYQVQPSAKLSFTFLDNQKQRKPFDFQFLPTYGSVLNSPAAQTSEDSAAFIGNLPGYRLAPLDFERVVQNSINASQRLYAGKWAHTLGRTSYTLIGGVFENNRVTCNYFQGVCLENQFADPNFTDDQFIGPLAGTCAIHPTCGADFFFGGEELRTLVGRVDLNSQATDHHQLQAGVLYQKYDLKVDIFENVGVNVVSVHPQSYASKPYDVGVYVSDKIEYDFLTLKLGARFDYGRVPGSFFADPLDPTNGTTATDVCRNPGDPRWGGANGVTFGFINENGVRTDTTLTTDPNWATNGCSPDETKIAGQIASSDDFKSAEARKQFSPRIGVSFPISQTSSVFFNFGKFSQNPLLHNLLTNTGIGTLREGLTTGPKIDVPGEGEPGLIGNPNLKIEQSTTYEMGYLAEFARVFALGVTLFNKNQTGLTGIRTGGQRVGRFGLEQIFDPGLTYSSDNTPSYSVLVNQDFVSVRGIEVQLRRRVRDFWGFDFNYSYSRARTNASEPERETERVAQGDPLNLTEVSSDIDQPHVFNASLIFQVEDEAPKFRFGSLLRNTTLSGTVHASSGFPYTPAFDFVGNASTASRFRNDGRGPGLSTIDLLLRKGFRVSNLKYDVFAQVANLLDRKNCVTVFALTGQCFSGAVDQTRNRQGNTVRPDIATSTFTDRADYFGERRTILGGVRVSF